MPIIVMVDRHSEYVSADMIPHKGNYPHVVKRLAQKLKTLGYKRLVLKSDPEPAIQSLKEAIIRERPDDIMFEDPPVYSHQSNGLVERTISKVQGQVRTMRSALESRVKARVRRSWDIVPWLVRHAAATLSRSNVGEDGETPHSRVRGRKFRGACCELGEIIMYMKADLNEKHAEGTGQWESEWEKGIWLGIKAESGEAIVGTCEGFLKARRLHRCSQVHERWNAEAIQSMKGTPWEVVPGREGIGLTSHIYMPEEKEPIVIEERTEEEKQTRRVRITSNDIVSYGMMPGCHGCVAWSRGSTGRTHTEECRMRMQSRMRESNATTMARTDARITQNIADQIKKQDDNNKRGIIQEYDVQMAGNSATMQQSSSSGIKRNNGGMSMGEACSGKPGRMAVDELNALDTYLDIVEVTEWVINQHSIKEEIILSQLRDKHASIDSILRQLEGYQPFKVHVHEVYSPIESPTWQRE